MHNFCTHRIRERLRLERCWLVLQGRRIWASIMLSALFLKVGKMPGFWMKRRMWSMGLRAAQQKDRMQNWRLTKMCRNEIPNSTAYTELGMAPDCSVETWNRMIFRYLHTLLGLFGT